MDYEVRHKLITTDKYDGSFIVCRLLSGVISAEEAAIDLDNLIKKR